MRGNEKYIHLQADERVSLHQSDNLFGTLDRRDDDVVLELNISTLSRILKVTQFSQNVNIVCEVGLPVRLKTQIGRHGSRVDVFIQPETNSKPS